MMWLMPCRIVATLDTSQIGQKASLKKGKVTKTMYTDLLKPHMC